MKKEKQEKINHQKIKLKPQSQDRDKKPLFLQTKSNIIKPIDSHCDYQDLQEYLIQQ